MLHPEDRTQDLPDQGNLIVAALRYSVAYFGTLYSDSKSSLTAGVFHVRIQKLNAQT